ncbi:hypothetical protein BDF21DRAFT_488050 [Thamnidium elegans]|nr:hypothetical protein BDF21DRAFT_488050 [Thamnidium elegans]
MDLSVLHWSIDCTNVNAIFDPVGDGNCGYRAIAYLHYGNEDMYRDVKKDMLVAFEANKDKYARFFGFDIVSLEKNIKSDMYSYTTSLPIWFDYPGCVQVIADTYDIPVCMYPDAGNKSRFNEAITALPLRVPTKPKVKVQPYHIQNIKNAHWVAVKFGHRRMSYPSVSHIYFHIDDSYATLFKSTWNLFGQFPKHIEGKPFDAQKNELVVIESSDEE